MTSTPVVGHERVKDGISMMVIDRPEKKNALSIHVRNEISDLLESLATDDTVRCVILTGQGSVFSAGFDLAEFADMTAGMSVRIWASSDRFHHAVLRFPLPLIAAVNGPTLAGGFDLACPADVSSTA